ncbi:MAG: hypothetical protein QW622_02280 [Candidatus Pacearchaeota archaeon]
MKKEGRVLALIFLSMFMISFVASIVAAANVFDPIRDMFASWEEGKLSVNIAKYAFVILLLILIYSIASIIPFVKTLNVYLKIIFAGIIAFLSTSYLTPEEVYSMLVSYGASGLILGGIIPLIFIIFFAFELSKEGVGGLILSQITLIGFVIFLVVKLISFLVNSLISGWILGFYIALIVISLILTFKIKQFSSLLLRKSLEAGIIKEGELNKVVIAQRIKELERLKTETTREEEQNRLQAKIDRLKRFLGSGKN